MVAKWREVLDEQRDAIETTRGDAEHTLAASALRIAQLQARIVRLDALGERLTEVGRLDEGEFDSLPSPRRWVDQRIRWGRRATNHLLTLIYWIGWRMTLKTVSSNLVFWKLC